MAATEGQSSSAGLDPAHPEQWSEEMRVAAAKAGRDLFDQLINGGEYAQAMDAIQAFRAACEGRNVDYVDAFLTGDTTAEEYEKVDTARKFLSIFWKNVRKDYLACRLQLEGGDFFSPNKRWFHLGNEYRDLVEPLDIANWYKAGIHLEGSRHYIDTVHEGENGKRPSQYAFLDRLDDARGYYVDTLAKAREYKRRAIEGTLQIHKLQDARADPPRGFLRASLIFQLGPGDASIPLSASIPSPTALPDETPPAPNFGSTPASRFKGPDDVDIRHFEHYAPGDYATHASTVIYLHIVKSTAKARIADLLETLHNIPGAELPIVTVKFGSETDYNDIFESKRAGDLLSRLRLTSPPLVDSLVCFTMKRADEDFPIQYLVLHGKNLSEVDFRWHSEGGALQLLKLVHKDTLKQQGLLALIEKPESIVTYLPAIDDSRDCLLYLECWKGLKPIGNQVSMRSSLFSDWRTRREKALGVTAAVIEKGGLGTKKEMMRTTDVPAGASIPPATTLPDKTPPAPIFSSTATTRSGVFAPVERPHVDSWPYDIFISHAGPVKDLARDLENDLHSLGFTAFVDITSLHPGDNAANKMIESAQRAPIGLVLFDKNFVLREWPLAELKLIMKADHLLPVVVGMSHSEFGAALRASEVASQLDDVFFERLIRTTFVVDQGGWQGEFRQRICFAVTRMFVLTSIGPGLPNTIWGAGHVERALKAAKAISNYHLTELTDEDCAEAKAWVEQLGIMLNMKHSNSPTPPVIGRQSLAPPITAVLDGKSVTTPPTTFVRGSSQPPAGLPTGGRGQGSMVPTDDVKPPPSKEDKLGGSSRSGAGSRQGSRRPEGGGGGSGDSAGGQEPPANTLDNPGKTPSTLLTFLGGPSTTPPTAVAGGSPLLLGVDPTAASSSASTSAEKTLQRRGRHFQAGLGDANLLLEGLEGVPEHDTNLLLAKALYIRPQPAGGLGTSQSTPEKTTLDSLVPEGLMVPRELSLGRSVR